MRQPNGHTLFGGDYFLEIVGGYRVVSALRLNFQIRITKPHVAPQGKPNLNLNKAVNKNVSEHKKVQFPYLLNRWAAILSSPIDGNIMLGPNWFASVMGTGIIAVAGAELLSI